MKTEELEDARFFNTFARSGTQWNRDPPCWRYMDLLSLLTILEKEALHFTHIRDLYRYDPSEGTGGLLTNVVNSVITPSLVSVPSDPHLDERNREEIERIHNELRRPPSELLAEGREKVRRWDEDNRAVYISCWHTNTIDSDFMWRIYGKMEYGFAIQSSVQSVVYAIRDAGIDLTKIGFGFVVYPTIDERIRDRVEESWGSLGAFMVKSPQYQAENEFRVFVKAKMPVPSCDLPVDLRKLIQNIRISPMVPDWAIKPILSTLNPICSAKGLPEVLAPTKPLREA